LKGKSQFVCQNCGAIYPKWMGQCNHCGEWNTLEEQIIEKNIKGRHGTINSATGEQPVSLSTIKPETHQRVSTNISELDRVLGGGLMPGSAILIGGEPGIGKSTLLLQLILKNHRWKSLYVAGEESLAQIKDRADRLGNIHENCFITPQRQVEEICQLIHNETYDLVVIDSIQTVHSNQLESIPGTISQIRESAYQLINQAKSKNTPLVLVGHITKIGNIAGPKVLEHLVDTVLQFEGDSNSGLRILRTTKNRFGNTAEIGIFEMQNTGLVEITNPTEFLLTPHSEQFSGTAFALINEGLRPLVVEVQALVSNSGYSTPQRTSNGYDPKRLNMLLAVLEKRAGLKLSTRDVFVNVTGGLKVTDTAADMAIAAAIIGSYLDIAISSQTCFAGEIGLSGEIRPMRNLSSRIEEANRLGFNYIITAPSKKINPQFSYIPVNDIRNLVTLISKS